MLVLGHIKLIIHFQECKKKVQENGNELSENGMNFIEEEL